MNLFRLTLLVSALSLLSCLPEKGTEKEDETQSGAGLAMEAWSASRFSVGNSPIPSNALLTAYEKSRAAYRGLDKASWKALGPKNIGGRTLCLAFHPTNPDLIYAGSASGGLWRTYSAGEGYTGWVQVPINLPVYSVASILISNSNPNTLYVGTGEVYNKNFSVPGIVDRTTRGTYGLGIIKSTDGGVSWKRILNLNSLISGVQDMEFDPYDDHIIYAATTQGLYKTTNEGQTWTLIHDVPMAVDIDISPKNPEIIFVTHGSYNDNANSGIYRSNNSGHSFIKLKNGLPESYSGKAKLAISPSNPDIIYASIADALKSIGLFMTIDGGNTWDKMNAKDVANVQGWYSHDVAVDPKDQNFISYVGQNVYLSENKGVSFTNVSSWDAGDMGRVPVGGKEGDVNVYVHADVHATYFHPLRPTEIYYATDGGIFLTKNRGGTFEGRNGGYQTSQFYANFSASRIDSKFAVGGMQDNGTAIYDGQDAWIKVIGGDGMSTAIHGTNENIIFGTYQFFGLNRSQDRGKTFDYIVPSNFSFINEIKSFNTPFEVTASNPNAIYVGAQKVYLNENNGNPNAWQALHVAPLDPNAAILTLSVSPTDPTVIFASTSPINEKTNPKVFKSTNAGANWQQITNLPVRAAMDITFDPSNSQIVYIVFSGFDPGTHVFKSTDGGTNWFNMENGLPDVPVNCLSINPRKTNELYLGNDLGVYFSSNGGLSWERFMEGLPNAVMAMSISITSQADRIKVATHGNGVYESPLALGVSTTEIPNASLKKFIVYPNPAIAPPVTASWTLSKNAVYNLNVVDLQGKLVFSKHNQTGFIGQMTTQFNTSAWGSGIYLVTLEGNIKEDNSPFYLSRKLIVQ